jgi:tRNA pseudouridine38-40 synthase
MNKILYRFVISYDGSHYHGFVKQPELPTIQGVMEEKLKQVIPYQNRFRFYGASRTDAHVHARHQICLLNTDVKMEPEEIFEKLSPLLPADIKLFTVDIPEVGFDLISGCQWKEYHYYFSNIKDPTPADDESTYYTNFFDDLDFEKMKQGAKLFEGFHDFRKFQYKGHQPDMRRKVFECDLLSNQKIENSEQNLFMIKVRGKGFLRHMVRIMVGTLIRLGSGEIELSDLEKALSNEYPEQIGFIAPGKGLYLHRIEF